MSYAIKGQCVQHDSRGTLWFADFHENVEKQCLSSAEKAGIQHISDNIILKLLFEGSMNAKWKCLEGEFETPEPDRSECHHDWVEDIENMVCKHDDTMSSCVANFFPDQQHKQDCI